MNQPASLLIRKPSIPQESSHVEDNKLKVEEFNKIKSMIDEKSS